MASFMPNLDPVPVTYAAPWRLARPRPATGAAGAGALTTEASTT